MPAGLGDIMVIVRAEDFASRTLRRVSGELAGMSRQQAIAMQTQRVAWQKASAVAQIENAQYAKQLAMNGQILTASNRRRLSYIAERNALSKRLDVAKNLQATESKVRGPRGRFLGGISQQDIRNWQNAANAAATYGITGKNVGRVLSDTSHRGRTLSQQVDHMTERIQKFDPTLRRASASVGALGTAFYRNQQQGLGWSAALGRANARLQQAYVALDDAQRAEMALNQAIKAMPINRVHDFASALSGAGRTMQLWGAVGVGIAALTSAMFASFSRSVTLAATQTRQVGQSFTVTAKNADLLQTAIMQLMSQFPASADEMSKAAYDIYSSIDVSFGTGIRLLRMFNKVAVAGQVDLATATSASISILENFDQQLKDHGKITARTTELMNLMFATVRYGRMTFSQFNDMLNQVVPAATNAQQSFEDVAGAMAVMTRHMPSQTRAATALARVLDVITLKDFRNGMRQAGLAIEDTNHKLLPFPEIVEKVAQFAAATHHPLNDLIVDITRAGRGFTGLGREGTFQARRGWGVLIKNLNEYRRVQGNVLGDTTEFNRAYLAMSQTLGVRWQVMINKFKVLILTIGEEALPVLLKIGDTIGKWVESWRKLDPTLRHNIVTWGTWASVIILVSGILAAIAGVIGHVSAMLLGLFKTFGGPGVENTLLGRSVAFLMTMRGIAALGTITVGVDMMIDKKGDWKYFGALLTALGVGLLGGARAGVITGSVIVGMQLYQKGGNWQYLATFLAAAGLVGSQRGPRAGAVAGLLSVGVQLVYKGGGWNTYIGAALLAAGAGLATGQPLVIPLVFAASITWSTVDDMKSEQALRDRVTAMRDQIQQLTKLGYDVPPGLADQLSRSLKQTITFPSTEAALSILGIGPAGKVDRKAVAVATQAYNEYIRSWNKSLRGRQPERRGMGDFIQKARVVVEQPDLRTIIRATEQWTKDNVQLKKVVDQLNNSLENTATSGESAAIRVASAMAHGKLILANKLVQQFLKSSAKISLTWANVAKEVEKAVEAEGAAAGAQVLQNFIVAQEQAAQDMKQYNDEMKQRARELQDTMVGAASTALDTLRGLYQDIVQVNQQMMGDLFKGPWLTSQTFDLAKEWGITPRLKDIIKDMREQRKQFQQERNLINQAFKKGIPPGFLDEIKKMTPEEAMPILKELVTATPKQINAVVHEWNSRQKLIKNAAKVDFKNEIAAYKKAGFDMGKAMINGFGSAEVGVWFDTWIKKTFPQLINAAVAEAVAQWKKENPAPTKPGAVGQGNTQNNTTNNTKNDNRIIITVPESVGPHVKSNARYVAWLAKHHLRPNQVVAP